MSNVILVLDTETSGLDHTKHALLTLGAVAYNSKTDSVLDQIEWKLQSGDRESEIDALRINGIDIDEHNLWAYPYRATADAVTKWIRPEWRRAIPLGHNFIHFDRAWIDDLLGLDVYKKLFSYATLDTMPIVTWMNHVGAIKTPGTSLQKLCDHYDIHTPAAHTALGDCLATLELYRKLRGVMGR